MARRRRRAKRARTRDWAGLTAGPAGQIAELVLSHGVADYLRFRAVCAAWRASTDDPRAHGDLDRRGWRFHPRRWIMLPRPFHINSRRPFLDVTTGDSIHVRLPDLYARHHVLGSTAEGLLLLLCRKGTRAVQLLNPLTGQVTGLPRVTALLKRKNSAPCRLISNFRVASAGLAGDSMVALRYGDYDVAVAKPGDKCWTKLQYTSEQGQLKSAMSFAGRFYCVTFRNILVVEATASQQPRLAVAVDFEPGHGFTRKDELELVDNGGELILVHCVCHPDGTDDVSGKYTAYRVKLDTRKIEAMHGLCGRALFMGVSRSLSMNARVSRSISADTVYKCYSNETTGRRGRPCSVVAIDVLGRCFRPKFGKDDIAYCLSSYVCA